MNAIALFFFALVSNFSGSLEIQWGTSDTTITFMQNFYSWAKFRNASDTGEIVLDEEKSRLDFYIKSSSEEYCISRAGIREGDEIALRPNNSVFIHFGDQIGRAFGAVSDTQYVLLVARSRSKNIIIDSTRRIKIIPPGNINAVNWFYTFDTLRGSSWYKENAYRRMVVCRNADSLLKSAFKGDKSVSVLKIAAFMELSSQCNNSPTFCLGIPNFTTPYVSKYSDCLKMACHNIKTISDLSNTVCNGLFEERNKLTMSLLKNPRRIDSDNEKFYRFVSIDDSIYYARNLFQKTRGDKK